MQQVRQQKPLMINYKDKNVNDVIYEWYKNVNFPNIKAVTVQSFKRNKSQ